ncbi:hypothetical protein Golomagni_03437 [Golovinomyces magnicellulatus]|nr:hypothetical protein Golomagni_03437 [Golovinomyces magnicellulatus]
MIKRSFFRPPSRLLHRYYTTKSSNSASLGETAETLNSENLKNGSKSDATEMPSILQKIRKDLKIALQNKETVKLTVIRGLIDATRAKPIKNDIHMLALINKAKKENQMAIDHYKVAGRQDLVEKQEVIARILEEYASSVETISLEVIKKVVEDIIENYRARNEKAVFQQVLLQALKSTKLPSDKLNKADVIKVLHEVLPSGKSGAVK